MRTQQVSKQKQAQAIELLAYGCKNEFINGVENVGWCSIENYNKEVDHIARTVLKNYKFCTNIKNCVYCFWSFWRQCRISKNNAVDINSKFVKERVLSGTTEQLFDVVKRMNVLALEKKMG